MWLRYRFIGVHYTIFSTFVYVLKCPLNEFRKPYPTEEHLEYFKMF